MFPKSNFSSNSQNGFILMKFTPWHSSPTISLFLIPLTVLRLKAQVFTCLIRLWPPWPPARYSSSFPPCFSCRSLHAVPQTYQEILPFILLVPAIWNAFPTYPMASSSPSSLLKSRFLKEACPGHLHSTQSVTLYYNICIFLLFIEEECFVHWYTSGISHTLAHNGAQ